MRDAKESWRLIIDSAKDAATNMAIDEAILEKTRIPTLRLYRWSPPAVSLGYFQSVEQEVDREFCRKNRIDIVRRITGGGAVFHDHELTYSFICDEKLVPMNILRSYEKICGVIVNALNMSGICAQFKEINDIIVNNKKISGSAQTRRNNKVLQHGTIIIRTDTDRMFSVLKVPDEKIKDKLIRNVKERVTSLSELGFRDMETLQENIVKAFEQEWGVRFREAKILKEEQDLLKKLIEKFRSREWNDQR